MYVSCLVHELISSWNLKSLQFKRLLLLGQLVAYIVDIYTSLLVIVRCRAIVHSFFNIYLCVCTNRIYVEFQCVKLLNEESVKMKLCHWTTRRRNHFARFFFFRFSTEDLALWADFRLFVRLQADYTLLKIFVEPCNAKLKQRELRIYFDFLNISI